MKSNGNPSKRGSVFQQVFRRGSVKERSGDHRWDGLNEDMLDLPAPPSKILTLVIPFIFTAVAVSMLILFFASYPKADQASTQGECQISGFVAGTDCVDCRLTIEIDSKLKGDIQVTFKKEDGKFIPENAAFKCCPVDEKNGCCGWKDEFGKFCDIVKVEGSSDGCDYGPWSCLYAPGSGNSAHNIQHGTKAQSFLFLIVGIILLFCVLLVAKYNNYTYNKRIAIVHMNMQANERHGEQDREKKAQKKSSTTDSQIILVKQRKMENQDAETPKESQTPKEKKKSKIDDQPKSPFSAPAKMSSKSRSFGGESSPTKDSEKSPKKGRKSSKDPDVAVEVKGAPAMSSPSNSSLAQRRGLQRSLSQNDGFRKAPALDDVSAPDSGMQV